MPNLATNPFCLGKVVVPTPGTPVNLTANFTGANKLTGNADNGKDLYANKVVIQALPATGVVNGPGNNAGTIYVGMAGMNKSTGANVLASLNPGDPFELVEYSLGSIFHVGDFFIDADNAGDGVLAFTHSNM